MRRFRVGLLLISFLAIDAPTAQAQAVRSESVVELIGDIAHPDQLSAVARCGDLMVVCPDEGAEFNVFKEAGSSLDLVAKVILLEDSDEEIDMEGAACDAEYLYIVGSHSIRRRLIDEESTYKKNRKRLTRIAPHTASYSLFRIKLDTAGQVLDNERIDLRDVLEADDVLGPYFSVPGKENGIDIEGVAVKDGLLHVGFRGPVLRGNFVPVISLEFDEPHDYELNFVELEGRGIRDLVAVDGGFLILGGAVGDGDASYRLYFWNGQDCVPGEGGYDGYVSLIGEIPTKSGVKPEGIAVMADNEDEWRLLIVSDGDTNARTYVVRKPRPLRGSE